MNFFKIKLSPSKKMDEPISLPERMKSYEHKYTTVKFDKKLPLCIRLDGCSFSKFTKGMAEEEKSTIGFSAKFADVMKNVAKTLMHDLCADVVYVSSDEITLMFKSISGVTELPFTGKHQKMLSIIAGKASSTFTALALKEWPERCDKRLPFFDCRIFQLPDITEMTNNLLWRCRDTYRNGISTVARVYFTHSELHGVSTEDMLKMLKGKGITMNNIPKHFYDGTFYKKEGRKIVEVFVNDSYGKSSYSDRVKVLFCENH